MLRVAAIQCSLGDSRDTNVERVVGHIREAAKQGAQVVLPPELFEERARGAPDDRAPREQLSETRQRFRIRV
ncbi:MAG: hypothetical protein AAF658_05820, partial [Myxococcota bacterium]